MEIVVLCGGESSERAVSLRSGERVAKALRDKGHSVLLVDYRQDPLEGWLIARLRCADAVFLALHGGAGEDGSLQAELEEWGIYHYTGSGPEGAALAMDKAAAKRAVLALGVPTADGLVLRRGEPKPPLDDFPAVIKPLYGGSSVGLRFLQNEEEYEALRVSEALLCERFLPGREFTVGVLGGHALPVVEICPVGGVYDYHHKYTPGATEELCPAPLTASESEQLQAFACVIFAALGLRDLARIDFRADGQGMPHFLEANVTPGMTATSLLPLAAHAEGIEFPTLCEQLAYLAARRKSSDT